MEAHILAERIANAIMMDKSFKGYHLIVEGTKDYKLYSKFINKENVRISEAFGFEKVKLALQILTERGFSNKIGIIDSDFSKILGTNHKMDVLFITDHHDIEIMIIKTSALETVIRTFCSKKKIEDFETLNNNSIREIIFALGKEVGLIKLANKIHELGLIFKPKTAEGNQIKYKDFIRDCNLSFKGRECLVDSLINYSRSKSTTLKSKAEIILRLEEISKKEYDLDQLVNGHDLSNILYLLIKKVFSSTSKMINDFNAIEDSLILAYEYEEFKKTQLYLELKNYETQLPLTILQ